MKCAIFHDYFGTIGGGERVAIAIAEALGADIITTDTESLERMGCSLPVRSLGETLKIQPFKQVSAAHRFSSCDVSEDYDLFIFSGNWAHHAAKKHHPNFWYCHTPVRVFYDLYDTFLKRQPFLQRKAFALWATIYRNRDQQAVAHVDHIVTNSRNTLGRIQRYYRRDAEVLFPPIDISRFSFREYGDFWLSVNRLYPEKRIELQVETFRLLPDERLVIVGGYAKGDHSGRYAERIMRDLPENVTILGEVTERKLLNLYAHCRGFVCTAMDEDFGMTPVEAMAAGKPVVAVNEGGYAETVHPDTGVLTAPDTMAISKAIRHVSLHPEQYKEACLKRAELFGNVNFTYRVRAVAERILQGGLISK